MWRLCVLSWLMAAPHRPRRVGGARGLPGRVRSWWSCWCVSCCVSRWLLPLVRASLEGPRSVTRARPSPHPCRLPMAAEVRTFHERPRGVSTGWKQRVGRGAEGRVRMTQADWEEAVARALVERAFRVRLLADPADALGAYGISA